MFIRFYKIILIFAFFFCGLFNNANIGQNVVKNIFGNLELHINLVEDVDTRFGRFFDLDKRGYPLKRNDWLNGSINIVAADAEVNKENYAHGSDVTAKKTEFLP